MSSPLAAFRKYQKILLAVFGVALMLVFTVGGLVSQYLGASQGGQVEDSIVVRWKNGQLRESQLQMHRYARNQLRIFQQAVIQTTTQRAGTPRVVVVPDTNAEASVVESLVLAEEARRLGMVVSDDAVLQYLVTHLSDDTISRDELAGILAQVTGGRMTQAQLFENLRTELLAHQLRVFVNGAAFDGSVLDTSISPGESFDYFKRLRRTMEAEVTPVAVEDFLDQVTDKPSDEEIKELYEEYKDAYPSPITPTPGFHRPMQAEFQWLKADFTAFLDREVADLPEEDIAIYYEENKNSYRKIQLPSSSDLNSATESANSDEPLSSDLSDPLSGQDAEAATENAAADADASKDDEPASEGAAVDDAAPQLDGNEPAVDTDDTTDDIGDSSDIDAPSRRYQEPDDQTEEAADLQAADGEEGAAVDQAAENTIDSNDEAEVDIEVGTEEADLANLEEAVVADEADEEMKEEEESEEEEIEYRPLEEVRDDIARQLARPLALTALTEAVDGARAELNKYFQSHVYWEAAPEDERGEPPTPPDFNELAEKFNMVAGEIPLITILEADEYDLGRAFELDFSTGQIRRLPFTQMGFSPDLSLYQPRSISAEDVDSKYVFWKVDEKEEYVPELDEARPEVVRYWKMKKAIPLAKAKAEEIAEQARDKGSSLRALFDDESSADEAADEAPTVTDTGEFTWMTFGASPTGAGAPRLSSVEGTEFVGEEFMKDVSSLGAGEFGVTINYPEKMVYVVYMKAVSGSQDELQELFLNQGLNMPVLFMARQDHMRIATEWYQNLEESVDLQWERPPLGDSGIR